MTDQLLFLARAGAAGTLARLSQRPFSVSSLKHRDITSRRKNVCEIFKFQYSRKIRLYVNIVRVDNACFRCHLSVKLALFPEQGALEKQITRTVCTSEPGKYSTALLSKSASLETVVWLTAEVYDSAVCTASSTARTVTVCALSQLPGVNVRGMLVLTVR